MDRTACSGTNSTDATQYEQRSGLLIAPPLLRFIEDEALPGTGVVPGEFWRGFAALVADFGVRNRAILMERDVLQAQIDTWHRSRRDQPVDIESETMFLRDIGYLHAEPEPFTVATSGVDAELSHVPGPQLVVPITNPRYVLNAANARWGSLYDALYGTDAVPEGGGAERRNTYNETRGQRVIERGKAFLDTVAPLARGRHADVVRYAVAGESLEVHLRDTVTTLRDPQKLIGYSGSPDAPQVILLRNHGLHVEIRIDRINVVGNIDPAGIADLVLEAAVTTIVDCEDSVATVDAWDKAAAYRTWLGLMNSTLTARFDKGDRSVLRSLNPDREYCDLRGGMVRLSGRSLLLIRNVGHHMYTDAVCDDRGPIPETILDAAVTSLIALHNLRGRSSQQNSRVGSIYIVKPKLHGPDEVALAVQIFERIESMLGLARCTIKMGLMDEERRTSANLASCIRAARERLVLINTGFLDRTGDEIHTAMEAGPVVRKGEMRMTPWFEAYERRNVSIGLACGLHLKAQIGKGMWAAPDRMAAMLEEKIAHPLSGATTAWVPSPTAATLHAIHYHQVDVLERQMQIALSSVPALTELLRPPIANRSFAPEEIRQELENSAQGILGYVVRWIDQGIGCSKVRDIHNVGLMEDRATLRISSQHIANWLRHGVITHDEVVATLKRMAVVVDRQNCTDPCYRPMAPTFDGPAFDAACALILEGLRQPNGYTEVILEARRRRAKGEA